jgi:hypothetical protein
MDNINEMPIEQLKTLYRVCYQFTEYYKKVIYSVRRDTRNNTVVVMYGPPEDDPALVIIDERGNCLYEESGESRDDD